MSTTRNKAIVKAFVEEAVVGVMQGERENFRDYLAPDIVFHTPRLTAESNDADALHAEVRAYAELLANPHLIVDFVIAEDDFVAIHLTSGDRGHGSAAPTDEPVEGGGMAILRVRDDKITDLWYYARHRDAVRSGAPL